ncbi:DUF4291 domain-containing protein [Candidatus Pacearchaeota archaeon]|nr:DUF4291 domain-containing protein [Candidatus Pacearchaeota archaeon]
MKIELGKIDDTPNKKDDFVAQYDQRGVLVYQAFPPEVKISSRQFQEGFRLNRTSWIKTSFLWIMNRSGWASKTGQEKVICAKISREFFNYLLSNATRTEEMTKSTHKPEILVQYDPDRDIFGNKLSRKAIQLGLRGQALESYASAAIISLKDITSLVVEQRRRIIEKDYDLVRIPLERPYEF